MRTEFVIKTEGMRAVMEILLRKASIDDMKSLIQLRIDYLTEDKGIPTAAEETAIRAQLERYFSKHIADGTFIAILAETDGKIVSAAYLAISEKPANQSFITGITGTIVNVLTYPEYRRKGIAAKVLEKLIEEAKIAQVSHISLSATSDGKELYEKLGFRVSNYTSMGLKII